MDAQEIEIKIRLNLADLKTLQAWLFNNATAGLVQEQTDIYFENPAAPYFTRDLSGNIQALKYLRLRTSPNGKNILTFKDWDTPVSKNGDRLFCYEHETVVDNPNSALEILKGTGFTSHYRIQKKRSYYYYTDFEFALDQITELGTFLEIEVKTRQFTDPVQERARLIDLANQIGLRDTTLINRGYILLLFDQRAKN
ncbi:MAG: class IV adenylate cyclase [Rickettsiales bacterium]|nr:class IV adenylate cyclase [Rickettsiales bacterium]|tara:strand:+ start:12052 stop:12642 length:591 start_codon:yes stop_codon:yes gene_type:complete